MRSHFLEFCVFQFLHHRPQPLHSGLSSQNEQISSNTCQPHPRPQASHLFASRFILYDSQTTLTTYNNLQSYQTLPFSTLQNVSTKRATDCWRWRPHNRTIHGPPMFQITKRNSEPPEPKIQSLPLPHVPLQKRKCLYNLLLRRPPPPLPRPRLTNPRSPRRLPRLRRGRRRLGSQRHEQLCRADGNDRHGLERIGF